MQLRWEAKHSNNDEARALRAEDGHHGGGGGGGGGGAMKPQMCS